MNFVRKSKTLGSFATEFSWRSELLMEKNYHKMKKKSRRAIYGPLASFVKLRNHLPLLRVSTDHNRSEAIARTIYYNYFCQEGNVYRFHDQSRSLRKKTAARAISSKSHEQVARPILRNNFITPKKSSTLTAQSTIRQRRVANILTFYVFNKSNSLKSIDIVNILFVRGLLP